jgi:hypothetical protein
MPVLLHDGLGSLRGRRCGGLNDGGRGRRGLILEHFHRGAIDLASGRQPVPNLVAAQCRARAFIKDTSRFAKIKLLALERLLHGGNGAIDSQ